MEENKGFEQLEDGTTLYDILGEEFKVTEQLDRSFQLERIYPREISEYRALGKKEYSRLNSIIKMGKNLDVVFDELKDRVLDDVVQRLIEYGVYDYDSSRLHSEYNGYFQDAVDFQIEHFLSPISRILNSPNLSTIQKMSQASERFSSEESKRALIDTYGLYRAAGHEIEKEILTDGYVIEYYEYDRSKAEALCSNCVRANNISRERQRSILYQAFEADPLNANVIEIALILKLDDSGGLTEYAKRYGFYGGFLARQKEVLERKYADRIKTIVSCKAIPDNKTFCELAASCAIMHDEGLDVSSYLKKLVDMRITAGLSAEDVANLAYFLHTAEDSFGKATIDEIIQQFTNAQVQQELDSRTVNGVVYETHEQASEANAEVEKIRQLFSKRSETAGFSLLMELNIVTEAGKKEYEMQEQKLMKNYLEGWRLPKTYIMILIAVLVITIFINPLITLLGALVFAAAIFMSKKKCKEFEQVFRIEGNHIVRR